jgi:2-polyprenyl-3-methyl-5-hydroxy-6-metoxy-1,4-benzoquinol methylase
VTPMTLPATGEKRGCPACDSVGFGRRFGEQGEYRWMQCGECGCRYVDPMPPAARIEELYEEYYHPGNLTVPGFVGARLREIVSGFAGYRRTGRLLDVGFGAGALLEAAEELGWECWGTELDPKALEQGRRHGWKVTAGELLDLRLPAGEFDVLCMVELIEHVREPSKYLARAHELLREGGLLYVTTPNGGSASSRWLKTAWSVYSAPEHLQLFSPGALRQSLATAGFRACRIRTEGFNPAEFFRARRSRGSRLDGRARVAAAYELNAVLSSKPALRLLKQAANQVLNWTRLGDGLKGFAERGAA